MYTFGPPALGFAATLKTETFQAKVFTEEAPQVALTKAIAAKRSTYGVFSVKKSRDRSDMRNVHARQIGASVHVLFHGKARLGTAICPRIFGGKSLRRARLKISTEGN